MGGGGRLPRPRHRRQKALRTIQLSPRLCTSPRSFKRRPDAAHGGLGDTRFSINIGLGLRRFKITTAGARGNQIFVGADSASPGQAAKGSADTWCAGLARGSGGRRGRRARRAGRAAHPGTDGDRRTPSAAATGAGQAGSVRKLWSPKTTEAAATRGGERRPREPPLHLYPPAPGAAGRRAPRDLGAVVPAHSARGPEAGRPRESDPARRSGATATPGARRTAQLAAAGDPQGPFL
ncbi:uncharacterized protein LOC144577192 [Callithrix jacchus]